ncbi:hypothetical protein OWV82_020014 [Melia azedarach]|uniref:Uncharacterized protein n=1 Tax=Melia azedarach TaxID=155640 RepID=A0ACC1X6N8_MELAZ|nr:hypothetical protein OWV82_020014 [Melia azedarach]
MEMGTNCRSSCLHIYRLHHAHAHGLIPSLPSIPWRGLHPWPHPSLPSIPRGGPPPISTTGMASPISSANGAMGIHPPKPAPQANSKP